MNNEDKYNELMHWLAYNFPGVYRGYCDKKDKDDKSLERNWYTKVKK